MDPKKLGAGEIAGFTLGLYSEVLVFEGDGDDGFDWRIISPNIKYSWFKYDDEKMFPPGVAPGTNVVPPICMAWLGVPMVDDMVSDSKSSSFLSNMSLLRTSFVVLSMVFWRKLRFGEGSSVD